ncbi:MAG: CHAD domain-containing protein [Candidatus Marinimicrobia bacterium]|nr:CHAD domain-containing protein [Candidatus Neomarinimicrobiota bacterium]
MSPSGQPLPPAPPLEAAHARQVTALALRLQDGLLQRVSAPARQRVLLACAAREHDRAYATHPVAHELVAARQIRRRGLPDLTPAEARIVALAVSLHRGEWQRRLAAARLTPRARRIGLRLAAILRVADGLDHSHLQDAAIVAIRRKSDALEVTVRPGWYAGNLQAAQAKADLWQAQVFPAIRLRADPKAPKPPARYSGVVRPTDSIHLTAQRLLYALYRRLADNWHGAQDPLHACFLHDFRVALRRWRAAERFFRPVLHDPTLRDFNRRLDDIGRALGPLRDLQVRRDFIAAHHLDAALLRTAAGRRHLEREAAALAAAARQVTERLAQPETAALLTHIRQALRTAQPDPANHRAQRPLRPFARRTLRETAGRLAACDAPRADTDPEDLHEIRRAIRRARYLMEFCAPALGKPGARFARRVKQVTDDLGQIHDADVHLAHATKLGGAGGRALERALRAQRDAATTRLRKHWRALRPRDVL